LLVNFRSAPTKEQRTMSTTVRVSPLENGVFNVAAVGVVASVSSGAPGAKAVQLLRSFSATLITGAAAEKADVLIRDGASGVRTILKRISLNCAAGRTDRVVQQGMNLVMTPGNVCTIEFAAAPTGTGFEAVEMSTMRSDQVSDSCLFGSL